MAKNFMIGDTVHVTDNNERINEKGFIIMSSKSGCYCTCSDRTKVIGVDNSELRSCRIVLTEQTLHVADIMNVSSGEPDLIAKVKSALILNEIANRI